MLTWLKGGAARLSAWNKARMERIQVRRAERKAQIEADQHHHSRFFLLTVPAIATICAAVTEWVWALLFCIEATGHIDLNYEASVGSRSPLESLWDFSFSAHWPVLIGLILATAPIVMISMVWLPVQFGMRGAGVWRRGTLIFAGVLANILVVVSGTVVMNYNRQESVREALVVEQSADAQRSMLVANVDDLRGELATLMNHRSTYVATAASVGATAYERDYVRQARATNDPRLPLLERALGSARRADELRAGIANARQAVATAAPEAASAANVQDNVGRELNTLAQYIEVWRPPFVAFICTIIGIFGAWWVLAMLERMNPRDVIRSGWAPEDRRIEDHTAEEPVDAQPMTPAREKVFDAETGREMVFRRGSKPTWAKKPERKGKPGQVRVEGGEVSVEYEGRTFSTSGARNEEAPGQGGWGTHGPSVAALHEPADEKNDEGQERHAPDEPSSEPVDSTLTQSDPPEIPDLTDEEAADIEAELAAEESHDTTPERPDDIIDELAESPAEGEAESLAHLSVGVGLEPADAASVAAPPVVSHQTQDEPPSDDRAPETRPERMIAAE